MHHAYLKMDEYKNVAYLIIDREEQIQYKATIRINMKAPCSKIKAHME